MDSKPDEHIEVESQPAAEAVVSADRIATQEHHEHDKGVSEPTATAVEIAAPPTGEEASLPVNTEAPTPVEIPAEEPKIEQTIDEDQVEPAVESRVGSARDSLIVSRTRLVVASDYKEKHDKEKPELEEVILKSEVTLVESDVVHELKEADWNRRHHHTDEHEVSSNFSEEDREVLGETVLARLTFTSVDEFEDSDMSTSHESAGSYVLQKPLEPDVDIFTLLREMPSLDDISLDVSEELVPIVAPREKSVFLPASIDVGYFVDPLTGEKLSSSTDTEFAGLGTPSEVEEETVDEEADDDFDLTIHDIEEFTIRKKLDEPHQFDLFLKFDAAKKVADEEAKLIDAFDEAELFIFQEQIKEFLCHLINRIVNECEYIDPMELLERTLDKEKLMGQVRERMFELEAEQKVRYLLNRKVGDYYRRKKSLHPFSDDNPNTIKEDINRYKENLNKLDHLLGLHKDVKRTSENKIASLEARVLEMDINVNTEVEKFENMVLSRFARNKSERIRDILKYHLSKMARARLEVSKKRYYLIQKQHTLATVIEKIKQLDVLGDGLSMRDYQTLTTETISLGKKIEERTIEIAKLRFRLNSELHVTAHLEEKQNMLESLLEAQVTQLQKLQHEHKICREYLYNLRIERAQIRRQKRDMSVKIGLLDKPELMRDYDDTHDKLTKAKANVEQLKLKYDELIHKLDAMQNIEGMRRQRGH